MLVEILIWFSITAFGFFAVVVFLAYLYAKAEESDITELYDRKSEYDEKKLNNDPLDYWNQAEYLIKNEADDN